MERIRPAESPISENRSPLLVNTTKGENNPESDFSEVNRQINEILTCLRFAEKNTSLPKTESQSTPLPEEPRREIKPQFFNFRETLDILLSSEKRKEWQCLKKQERENKLYESIDFGLEKGQINEAEAIELRKIVPGFNKGSFWKDIAACNIADYLQGWGLNILASWLIASEQQWLGMAIFLSPISIQGVIRIPYVAVRIRQELSHLQAEGVSPEIIEAYQKFYRAVFTINLIRFPPLPCMPIQVDNFTGALLTIPRGGKLNSLYLYCEIQHSKRLPRIIKQAVGKPLEWITKKLPQ